MKNDKTITARDRLISTLMDIKSYLSEQDYTKMDSIRMDESIRLYSECNAGITDLDLYDLSITEKSPTSLFIIPNEWYAFLGDQIKFSWHGLDYVMGNGYAWRGDLVLDVVDSFVIKEAFLGGSLIKVDKPKNPERENFTKINVTNSKNTGIANTISPDPSSL